MSPLSVADVQVSFGGVEAVAGVSFAIIGPNGAGKTTLLNVVSGIYPPHHGRVSLGGQEVTGLEPHLLARAGISRTFQNLQIFFRMSVVENVMVGRHLHESRSLAAHLFALPSVQRQNLETRTKAEQFLDMVGLAGSADRVAGTLPYGALRRLEIARALATRPKVLLLDEPAAGCNTAEAEQLGALIQEIAASGIAVILVSTT